MQGKIAENIIVDLYEMRASTLPPLQARKMERVDNVYRYSFLTQAISVLCDKYKIKNEDIEEVIRERSFDEQYNQLKKGDLC